MKKDSIIGFLLLISFTVSAQTCPQTSCKDSLAYTVTSEPLTVAAGYTNLVWNVESGPGTVDTVKKVITGLQAGKTSVLTLQATQGNMTAFSVKTITVAPPPVVIPVCPIIPPPRTVTGMTIDPNTGAIHFTFNFGPPQ